MQTLRRAPPRLAIPLVLLVLLVLLVPGAPAVEDAASSPPRALIVTGSDVPAHDWRATTPITRRILEDAGKFEVFVCEDAGVLESSSLARYDLVVLNYRNRPTEPLSDVARENLARFVREGKGLAAIHFALDAFREWPEYARMVGRVWKGKRQGGTSGHDPRGPFEVDVRAGEHPAAEGLASFTTDDELYSNLEGETPIQVMAAARSGFSNKVEAVAWTLRYGEGKVFVTSLGHDAKARENGGFRELLVTGCRWAAVAEGE